ncbi:protein phosphatase 2C 37-like [Carex rostrata]
MSEVWCQMGAAGTRDSCSRVARRRRMVLRRTRLRSVAESDSMAAQAPDSRSKRRRLDVSTSEVTSSKSCDAVCRVSLSSDRRYSTCTESSDAVSDCPEYGVMSICGRRREMEDTVSIHLGFVASRHGDLHHCHRHPNQQQRENYHFFGVFDGHGCSHVAEHCKERMHEIVAGELEQRMKLKEVEPEEKEKEKGWWTEAMEKCFAQMDKEAVASGSDSKTKPCSCELRKPRCNNVGSTATVAIVGPRHVVVANCGDSRAVLCRNGSAVPLSSDHKPDRPDELQRIQLAGGRVIYWDGPRVLGVLAMSRAIGDSYLKPFVISEPEVTVTEIKEEDECLILATDGLWDVVPNELACQVVSRCLRAAASRSKAEVDEDGKETVGGGLNKAKACADAAMLLTKMALARHTGDNISVAVINLRPH